MKAFVKNKIFPVICFRSIIRSGSLLITLCFLGCASNSKKIVERFYLLESRSYPKKEGYKKMTYPQIVISAIRLPSYLDRPQIVGIMGGNQVTFSERERWGDNLKRNIARVIRRNLMANFPHATIEAVPHYQRGKDSLFLSIEITSFAFDAGLGKVKLEAIWSLEKDNQSRKTYTDYISFPLGESKNTERIVSKMSDCLAELSNKIATRIEDFCL